MRKTENTLTSSSAPARQSRDGDISDAMRSATEYLIASRQAERALKAGNSAPFFRLQDQRGAKIASETLLRHGPLLLTFYTGLWCPGCNQDLKALETLRPSIEARGASLVSISQQTTSENAVAHTKLKLGFPILSDRGGRVGEMFGVRWCIPEFLRDLHRNSGIDLPLLNGEHSWTLAIPARFIVDRAGIISYSEVNPLPSHSRPQDVLPVLDYLCGLRAA